MEKRGVIDPDWTTPEDPEKAEKQAQTDGDSLSQHPLTRLAADVEHTVADEVAKPTDASAE